MNLKITNLAKIKEMSVKIDGITVIAGDNNTGKSTVGKTLFALYNSTVDLEKRVVEYRRERINQIIEKWIDSLAAVVFKESFYQQHMFHMTLERKMHGIVDNIFEAYYVRKCPEDIPVILEDRVRKMELKENINMLASHIEEVSKQIIQILEVDDSEVFTLLVEKYFLRVFNGQINNIYLQDSNAEIDLCIHDDQHLIIQFCNQKCKILRRDFVTMHDAIYIDSPFLIDHINDGFYIDASEQEGFLLDRLTKQEENNLFEEITANKKLTEIYQKLDSIFEGKVVRDKDGEYVVQHNNLKLDVKNLSTGLKAFTMLRTLLEGGAIREKDVLILDEPEIHLHPQWQLVYAEIIVLLEKYFGLSIVVTTHSPYFLDAIEVYSAKHGISERVNYYLSNCEGDCAELLDVTSNIDLIYKKLVGPIDALDSIRY